MYSSEHILKTRSPKYEGRPLSDSPISEDTTQIMLVFWGQLKLSKVADAYNPGQSKTNQNDRYFCPKLSLYDSYSMSDYQNDRYFSKWPLFGRNDRSMAKMTDIMTELPVL